MYNNNKTSLASERRKDNVGVAVQRDTDGDTSSIIKDLTLKIK